MTRPHCALYVDAGYLLAGAATRATGSSQRQAITVDYPRLIADLIAQVEELSGLPLLRVHWYDAATGPQARWQLNQLADLARVKVRLGRINVDGQQKGVDLKLGLDLVTHAQNGVADVAYLVSGDDDLTEAVEVTQDHGVRVVVLAVPDGDGHPHGIASHLRRESDGVELIATSTLDSDVELRAQPVPVEVDAAGSAGDAARTTEHAAPVPSPAMLAARPKPGPPLRAGLPEPLPMPMPPRIAYSSTTGGPSVIGDAVALDPEEVRETAIGVVDDAITAWRRFTPPDERERVLRNRPSIPTELDGSLLRDLSRRLGIDTLDESSRHVLRDAFWTRFDELGAAEG